MGGNRNSQRGVSLSGLLMASVVVAIVAMLGAKLAPEVIEYYQIQQSVKGVAQDPVMREASVQDIRKAFRARATVERIEAITPEDLDISKDVNGLVISFAYSRRVPLFANVSLMIDFQGTSASK